MIAITILYSCGLFILFCRGDHLKYLRFSNDLTDGEALLTEIQQLIYQQQGKISKKESALPQYKFYTEILKSVLDYARQWGGSLGGALPGLQSGIRQELKADRQMLGIFWGAMIQFLASGAITWLFSWGVRYATAVSAPLSWRLAIGLWQLLGVFLFNVYFRRAEKIFLFSYRQLLASIYRLKCGASAGLSPKRVVELAEMNGMENGKTAAYSGDLGVMEKRLQTLLYQYTQLGQGIAHELQFLLDDLWHYYGEARERLNRRASGIKFMILAIFFLSSHLLFFLSLMSRFLIEEV